MDNRNNDLSGLGDFTAGPRVVTIGAMAVGIGIVGAYVALGLLKLIGLFTNLFFFQRWSTAFASPADHALGAFVILVPVVGALIIGFMARLYPVVDESQRLVGVVTRVDLQRLVDSAPGGAAAQMRAIVRSTPTVAHPDEPLRLIVHRMAETGLTRFPVVERGPVPTLVGMIALDDLLKARALNLEAERRRERVLSVRFAFPFGFRAAMATGGDPDDPSTT